MNTKTTATVTSTLEEIMGRVQDNRTRVYEATVDLKHSEADLARYLIENQLFDMLKPNEARLRAYMRSLRTR